MGKHALDRHATAVRLLSNGTNGEDLHNYMCTSNRGGGLFRQLTFPYTNMSAPGRAAKLGTTYNNIQTVQSCPSLHGIEPQHTNDSVHFPTMPAMQALINELHQSMH